MGDMADQAEAAAYDAGYTGNPRRPWGHAAAELNRDEAEARRFLDIAAEDLAEQQDLEQARQAARAAARERIEALDDELRSEREFEARLLAEDDERMEW